MNIQQIQTQSHNWHKFCYDDMSKQRREYIREHLEEPFKQLEIQNTGRLSEYELNQLIKSLALSKPNLKAKKEENPDINEEILYTADIQNLQPLYGDNSFRAGLNDISSEQIEIAKCAGIRRIVDLRDWTSPIKYDDMEYINFPLSHLLHYQEEKSEFNKEFVNFIQTMQKGNVLIGCEFGTETTNNALCLDFFFNPKAKIMHPHSRKSFGLTMQEIYENLSQNDKKSMGWNEEFDKNFLKRLEKHGYWVD